MVGFFFKDKDVYDTIVPKVLAQSFSSILLTGEPFPFLFFAETICRKPVKTSLWFVKQGWGAWSSTCWLTLPPTMAPEDLLKQVANHRSNPSHNIGEENNGHSYWKSYGEFFFVTPPDNMIVYVENQKEQLKN